MTLLKNGDDVWLRKTHNDKKGVNMDKENTKDIEYEDFVDEDSMGANEYGFRCWGNCSLCHDITPHQYWECDMS